MALAATLLLEERDGRRLKMRSWQKKYLDNPGRKIQNGAHS